GNKYGGIRADFGLETEQAARAITHEGAIPGAYRLQPTVRRGEREGHARGDEHLSAARSAGDEDGGRLAGSTSTGALSRQSRRSAPDPGDAGGTGAGCAGRSGAWSA